MYKEKITAYIYLIQDGIYKNTNVYKIGMTKQEGDCRKLKRIQDYSHGTIPYNIWKVNHNIVKEIESTIKKKFKEKYQLVKGFEWFEGNVNNMKKDIDWIIENMEIEYNKNNDKYCCKLEYTKADMEEYTLLQKFKETIKEEYEFAISMTQDMKHISDMFDLYYDNDDEDDDNYEDYEDNEDDDNYEDNDDEIHNELAKLKLVLLSNHYPDLLHKITQRKKISNSFTYIYSDLMPLNYNYEDDITVLPLLEKEINKDLKELENKYKK